MLTLVVGIESEGEFGRPKFTIKVDRHGAKLSEVLMATWTMGSIAEMKDRLGKYIKKAPGGWKEAVKELGKSEQERNKKLDNVIHLQVLLM